MTLLEFLDRVGQRRANRPQRPARDIRQFMGFAFLAVIMSWSSGLPAARCRTAIST
jgi:hypothetical protein